MKHVLLIYTNNDSFKFGLYDSINMMDNIKYNPISDII